MSSRSLFPGRSKSTELRPAPAPNPTIARQTLRARFACVSCAESAEHALRAKPGIVDADVDCAGGTVDASYHPELIDVAAVEELISQSTYDCRCTTDHYTMARGGGLASLAHKADMAAVTENTTADRMQYEFPSTHAGKQHRQEAHGNHGAMGHVMSDPRMARAMEADMRNRFFLALILTIRTLLFSPLAMNTFGIKLVSVQTANWIRLILSTPLSGGRDGPSLVVLPPPYVTAPSP